MFWAEITYKSWISKNGYEWIEFEDVELPPMDEILANDAGTGLVTLWSGKKNTPKMAFLREKRNEDDRLSPRQYEEFDPFKSNPVLYRVFASIPWLDKNAVIEFANKYGMLETDDWFKIPATPLPEGVSIRGRTDCVLGDPQVDWFEGSALLRSLIRVWESPESELRNLFRWENHDGIHTWFWHPHPDDAPITNRKRSGLLTHPNKMGLRITEVARNWDFADFASSDILDFDSRLSESRPWRGTESLKEVAQTFIHQELARKLTWEERDTGGAGYLLGIPSPSTGPMKFQIVPETMLHALFLQFGQAYQGNKDHRQCKPCGKWFELMPKDKGRKDFCSASCKVKDYRTRKQMVVELHQTGQTELQLAEATGTPLATIKKWLEKSPKFAISIPELHKPEEVVASSRKKKSRKTFTKKKPRKKKGS